MKVHGIATWDYTMGVFKRWFVAEGSDVAQVRTKHVRLGILIGVLFLSVCVWIFESSTHSGAPSTPALPDQDKPAFSGITSLTKGVSNEQSWTELTGKEVEAVKRQQVESEARTQVLEEKMHKEAISRDEVGELMMKLRSEMEASYHQKLESELAKRQPEPQAVLERTLETQIIKPKKTIRKIGEYIPANSYAQAKLISGVDAGVGITAEANPRQTLLRITGEAVSAGIGSEYLKTNRLIGCLLSAKAVGDISSEKVYLDGVLMTCAVDKHTAIEVPVKAYVTSHAKSGIRGEVIRREGDMVLKAFLAGISSGFGGGVAQMVQPALSLPGSSVVLSEQQKLKDMVRGGIGSGVSNSSSMLENYFIKQAEQHQPVISVNEGIEVYVVFQEGFSLKEEKHDDKAH